MKNQIYLRRKTKVLVNKGENHLGSEYIHALLKNIESLGYTLSPQLIEVISTLTIEQLKKFHDNLVSDLRKLVGDHVKYHPMYPNFPEQVKKASDEELYGNAIMHYWGDWIGKRILPLYKKEERGALKDNVKPRVINIGNEEEFESIFRNLLSSKTSITETDKDDVINLIKSYGNSAMRIIPEEIPLKENVALLSGILIRHTIIANDFIDKHVKTATDVLRVATFLSDGDISLAENVKFKSFSKRERKILLSALERDLNSAENMMKYKERWKRLGERLHPFDYERRFPKSCKAFDIIRNDKPITTFNSSLEKAILHREINEAIASLKTRPGEFARRLDNLIRLSDSPNEVIRNFSGVAEKVSSPVLLQIIAHFKNRNVSKDIRVFFPKGGVGKVQAIENKLPKISQELCQETIATCETVLKSRYKKLPSLGKVYIDENLRNYTVPFALRSASKALRTISRGSKVPLPDGNTIRFFIWWKDGEERTDIDLSVVALNSDHRFISNITYYNLKEFGGYHSGDITSAPQGASEFIDIEIDKFLSRGIRYVLMSVNSYTEQSYCDLPGCFAGIMTRQHPGSGEIYEPKTVLNKFDLTANTRICIPMIIDLETRELIWADLGLTSHISRNNNIFNNLSSMTLMAKAITSLVKPNLYDLFKLHVLSRGIEEKEKAKADTVFSINEGITPYDIEKIISEFI